MLTDERICEDHLLLSETPAAVRASLVEVRNLLSRVSFKNCYVPLIVCEGKKDKVGKDKVFYTIVVH